MFWQCRRRVCVGRSVSVGHGEGDMEETVHGQGRVWSESALCVAVWAGEGLV